MAFCDIIIRIKWDIGGLLCFFADEPYIPDA